MLTDNDIKILRFVNEFGAITIKQAYQMFFKTAEFSRDLARKRLKKLADMGELKYTTIKNGLSKERIYYKDKPISTHSLCLLDFCAALSFYGAENIEFEKEHKFTGIRPDALVQFDYKDCTAINFVEVVITHQVDYKNYEILKDTGELQKIYNTFPALIVINNTPQLYRGDKLKVKYLDYKLNDFHKIVLP